MLMQPAGRPSDLTGNTDLAGYIHLCSEIGASYNQGLAIAAAFQGTTIQGILSQRHGNKRCFKCGSLGHFKGDCPDNRGAISGQSVCSPEICPKCGERPFITNESGCRKKSSDFAFMF